MCRCTLGHRTIGSELIEIGLAFLLATLIGWAFITTTEGGELLQKNNTEGVGHPLESL